MIAVRFDIDPLPFGVLPSSSQPIDGGRRLQALREDKTARLWRKARTLDDKNEDWWTAVRRDLEAARARLEQEVTDLWQQVEAAGLIDDLNAADMKNG